MTDFPEPQGPDEVPIPPATRTDLLAELEGYEHLLFEPMPQADLDGLYALYDQWRATLGDPPPKPSPCAMPWTTLSGPALKATGQGAMPWSGLTTWNWWRRCRMGANKKIGAPRSGGSASILL